MKVTILGSGNSTGVPSIGCKCEVCQSTNPKNKRSRVSAFIEERGCNILIDSSPDLREQALKNNITRVDALLYTHAHADHANGIDDMRSFNYLSNKSIPAYGNAHTINTLCARFSYIFTPKTGGFFYGASLNGQIVPETPVGKIEIADNTVTYFQQNHAKINTLGYRIGGFAYSTDVKALPEESFEALRGVEVWVVDCLRRAETFSHSHLAQSLQWIARVQPRLAILTHMDHDFDYDRLSSELPSGVIPAYDGMIVEL